MKSLLMIERSRIIWSDISYTLCTTLLALIAEENTFSI